MLVIFCLFEYIYFLHYHPLNLDIINNMSEIFHATQQNKYLTLNKEIQLCRYTLPQELTNYKCNRRYPQGFRLKFNLSLCSDSRKLQRNCDNVLRSVSLR